MPSITYDPVETGVSPGALPRTQGASFTPAVGQALEQVGVEGTRIASDMSRIAYQQKISDGVTSIKQNIMSADEQFSSYMEQTKSEMPVNGAGYVDKFKDKFNDWYGQFVDQYQDPRLKKIATEQAATLHNRFYNQAASWQIGTNRAWRINTFHQSIQNDWNTLDKDPTQFEAVRKAQLETINALGTEIHPEDRITLTNLVNNTYGNAAAMAYARAHPQETINAIMGTTPAASGDTPTAKIVSAAQSVPAGARNAGLTPNVALAVANAENDTFDPNRKNPLPGQTATGLFQMIDSTWLEQGGTKESRFDPNAQAELGVKNLAKNASTLSSQLRRPLSPGEIYSTQWGLGFAGILSQARDGTPIRDVFARAGVEKADEAAALNGVAGMTAGQVRTHFETLMRERMVKTAGLAAQPDVVPDIAPKTNLPWLDDLSPSQREAVLTHAQATARHDDAGEKASLRGMHTDITAALNDGQQPQQTWDASRSLRVFGPEEGAKLNNEMMQAQWYGSAKSQLATASPQEAAEIVQQADQRMGTTAPGSFGYAVAKARSDSLRAAWANTNNARVADQVGEDQKSLQLTKPLDLSSPDFLRVPLQARYEQAAQLQKTWGMKDYKPFSDTEAGALTDFLSKGQPSEVVSYLAQMRVAAGDHSEWYSAAMQQIAPKAPLVAVAGATAPYDPQAAQLILAGAGMMKDEKILGVAADSKLFEERWNLTHGEAFGSYVENSLANLNAVKAAYAASLPADQRDRKSINTDIFDKLADRIMPVVDFNGPTLAPPGMTHDQFVSNVAERYNEALTRAGYDPKEYRMSTARLIPDPRTEGIYQVYSGLTQIRGAIINFNRPPDATFVPVSMDEAQPLDFARKMARRNPTFGRSKY